jgi:hypothetical protein
LLGTLLLFSLFSYLFVLSLFSGHTVATTFGDFGRASWKSWDFHVLPFFVGNDHQLDCQNGATKSEYDF